MWESVRIVSGLGVRERSRAQEVCEQMSGRGVSTGLPVNVCEGRGAQERGVCTRVCT